MEDSGFREKEKHLLIETQLHIKLALQRGHCTEDSGVRGETDSLQSDHCRESSGLGTAFEENERLWYSQQHNQDWQQMVVLTQDW